MGGFLTGLVKGATAGAVGYDQGREAERDKNVSLAALIAQREQQQQLNASRERYYDARSHAAENPAPKLEDKLHSRVQELVGQGMDLSKATAQARREYGQNVQAPPVDAVANHKAMRDYDVAHPTRAAGSRGASAATQKLAPAVRAAQALAGSDAHAATAAQTQLDNEFPAGAPQRAAYSKNPAGYSPDSANYANGRKNVDAVRARADSTNERAHELTTELVTQATGDSGDGSSTPAAAPSRPVAGAGSASSSGSFTPGLLKQHQQIDANAAAALKAGKDPDAVAHRAGALHAQLEKTGRLPIQ